MRIIEETETAISVEVEDEKDFDLSDPVYHSGKMVYTWFKNIDPSSPFSLVDLKKVTDGLCEESEDN